MDNIEVPSKLLAVEISDPAWYRAATLSERARSLIASGGNSPSRFDADLAERRLSRWRSKPPFEDEDSRLAERLSADGISEDDLRILLGEPAEATRDRFEEPPGWLRELVRAFSDPAPETALPSVELPAGEGSSGGEVVGFLYAIEPLVRDGWERLRRVTEEIIEEYPSAPFTSAGAREKLFPSLPGKLLSMLNRTMVLELNVARIEGLLEGETPEERFRSFIERLRRRDVALEIFREYPVLARQLVICVDQWVETGLEFLRRLCEDWSDIKERFCAGEDPGELVEVEGDAGDQHGGGRSVHIATFGSGFKLVYKPRPLAVDRHFQELLAWLNERGGDHPPFRTLSMLDRGTHGWVEYVEAHGCSSEEEVKRFYWRQGGYLALLYALHATDFHYENLIASGEHPVLVDLESIFHASPRRPDDVEATSLAAITLNESALGIGLLPQRLWGEEEQEGIDLSGLGGSAGQMTPHRLPYWESPATDEMRLARKRIEILGSNNRPSLGETEIDVLDYKEDIIEGFAGVYRLLVRDHEELGSSLLSRFAGDETRYIARPTRTYAIRLIESFHPDMLRDALVRDRFFDGLWVSGEEDPTVARADPKLARLFPHEQEDLYRGDIPAFSTLPNSRDLWSTSGTRIPDYLDQAPLEIACQRVRGLDEEDLALQIWIIRASLTALTLGEGRGQWPIVSLPEPEGEARREDLLSAARKVGDRLDFLALHASEQVNWLGLTLVRDRVWTLAPLGSGLYDGLPGIALFLGYLGTATGEEKYTQLARRTVATVRYQFEQVRKRLDSSSGSPDELPLSLGAFGEVGGAIHVLTHLGALWDRPELLDDAEMLATDLLRPLVPGDEGLDMIGGVSGCASVLLGLHTLRPEGSALEIAKECGEHLLSRARPAERGLGWSSSLSQEPLAGFSHGAAGIAHALLELSAATGEQRFRDTALEAIEYERSVFSREHGNWPDLRDPEDLGVPAEMSEEERFMTAWCHGAPGIGLSRLRAMEYLDDPGLGEEVEAAVRTTRREGFDMNHSLCHGALGNLELLLEAARTYGDPELLSRTYRTADRILVSIREHGWLCGVPLGVETPGLMSGLAGIGYGLLRLAEPERVPSVLTLSPPLCVSQRVNVCRPPPGGTWPAA